MRVGIDLGTTYSLIADIGPEGRPRLIPDCLEPDLVHTPSVVQIEKASAFVGSMAEALLETDPSATVVRFFKRKLGTSEALLYDEQGRGWRAEGIAALVLKKLAYDAESLGSSRVDSAVITVPAHFTDPQRRAVLAAAALAGLPVLGLVEEPVAAALHYGVASASQDRILLVYDFGGGTFDATALSLDEKGVYVLAKTGHTELGGKEIDERVAGAELEQFEKVLGRAVPTGARTLLELRRVAEELKIELCLPNKRSVRKLVLLAGQAVEVELRRDAFDAATRDLLDRTEAETLRCVEEAGLKPVDVTDVLMVGGSSFVPMAEERLKAIFCAPHQRLLHHEPSKAIAYGAALHAAQLAGDAEALNIPPELRGVTGYNVGVRTVDAGSGRVTVDTLIKKSMPLPVKAKKTYYTTRRNQERIVLDFVQFREPAEPLSLGRLTVGPLPPSRANHPVEVTTECRADGTVSVEAYDAHTGVALAQVFGTEDQGGGASLALQKTLVDATLINNLIQ